MIAPADPMAPALAAVLPGQWVASYGKSGGVGCFHAPEELELRRGDRVILQTPRGLELGGILGPATLRQARLLGAQTSGAIVRPLADGDAAWLTRLLNDGQRLFETGRRLSAARAASIEVLDAEVLLDALRAIVHVAAPSSADLASFAAELARRSGLEVHLENAALAMREQEQQPHAGCGKPDCGKAEGGGCSDCGAGGCSSCGQGPVDLRPYFAHLRAKMESQQRTPLL